MNTVRKKYLELIALTRQFLLDEYHPKDQLLTNSDTHYFFCDRVKALPSVNKTPINIPSNTPAISFTNTPLAQPMRLTPIPPMQEPPSAKPQIPIAHNTVKPLPPSPEPVKTPSLKAADTVNSPNKLETKPMTDSSAKTQSGFRPFTLEPNTPSPLFEAHEMKNLMKKVHPQCPIHEYIPSDDQAKKIKNAWQMEVKIPSVVLLSFTNQKSHLTFLHNLAHAINQHLGTAQVISGSKWEQENKWDQLLESKELRLVIASDHGLYLLPNLMKNYKEAPKNAKHFLRKTPLVLLSDISSYLKEFQLKPLLWRTICSEFHSANDRIS